MTSLWVWSITYKIQKYETESMPICFLLIAIWFIFESVAQVKMMFVVYPESSCTPGNLKNTPRPDHGGNRTYDLWNARPILC